MSGSRKTGRHHTGRKTKNDSPGTLRTHLCVQPFFRYRKHGGKTGEELKAEGKEVVEVIPEEEVNYIGQILSFLLPIAILVVIWLFVMRRMTGGSGGGGAGGQIFNIGKTKGKLVDKSILLSGYIGGRREPFTKGRASFVVIDNSIKKCNEIKGDNCPTPWDACCEDRRTILSSTLTVQIIDKNSSLLKGTLKDVDGLQPGKRIKVLGRIKREYKFLNSVN